MYRVDHYLLYVLSCCVNGQDKEYIGITGVLPGQTDEVVKLVRRAWHLICQKKWIEGMDPASVHLSTSLTDLKLQDALIEEARLTAARYSEREGHKKVRGGPWCRRVLPPEDRAEVVSTLSCSSRDAVKAVAVAKPFGSLAQHLALKSYSKESVPVPFSSAAPSVCAARTPLAVQPAPRQSGRHPPGVKRASGRHKAGNGGLPQASLAHSCPVPRGGLAHFLVSYGRGQQSVHRFGGKSLQQFLQHVFGFTSLSEGREEVDEHNEKKEQRREGERKEKRRRRGRSRRRRRREEKEDENEGMMRTRREGEQKRGEKMEEKETQMGKE